MSLLLEPREVVVGHDGEVKPRVLGRDQVGDQLRDRGLLAHCGVAEVGQTAALAPGGQAKPVRRGGRRPCGYRADRASPEIVGLFVLSAMALPGCSATSGGTLGRLRTSRRPAVHRQLVPGP